MEKRCYIWAAIHGFFAVAVGAFAAHALKQRLDSQALGWVETGARYQMYHALALAALGSLAGRLPQEKAGKLGWVYLGFSLGALIFSASLYSMAFSGWLALGAITPMGGLLMLLGWLNLAIFSSKYL
jgi:uncharacterized membrane protein YgdD (TMEM256/DUF423 family)